MFQRLIPLVLVLVISHSAFAETQTFTDTVRVVMGSRESQDEVRVYATQEAKRRVLDKVGVYLAGSTEIVRSVQESFGSPSASTSTSSSAFSDSTTVLQRIQTLTVGVVQTEVASEEWKSEGGAFVLTLVCRVTVDKDDALKRLTELLQDKQKVEDYQKVQEEVERLRGELAQLRTDLESAKSEKETKAVKEEVQGAINGMTAIDWLNKGLIATQLDDRIACFSYAIELNPNDARAYNNRGITYGETQNYNKAICDFNRALQIDPNDYSAYRNRGLTRDNQGDLDMAIEDYSKALLINPNDAKALCGRGGSYFQQRNYNQAIEDFSSAIQINPNFALAFYDRAIAYGCKGDAYNMLRDYQRAADLGDEDAKRELEKLR